MWSGVAHSQVAKAKESAATPIQSAAKYEAESFVGIWVCTAPEEEDKMRLELLKTGSWRVWSISSEAGGPKEPTQAGTWFIHDGAIFLRVEQSESDKVIPGMAFAFDIKTVSNDEILVTWSKEMSVTCKRERLAKH